MRLDRDDMYVLTAPDERMFVAYVANFHSRGDRWVYVTTDRKRFDGGIYDGEKTLETIQERFLGWWRDGFWRIGGE